MKDSWIFWALLSCSFAALMAIFAKIGVEKINPNLAAFLRTLAVISLLAAIVWANRQFQPLCSLSCRTYLFLLLSGLAAGASWLCYFRTLKLGNAARVAPIDKFSTALAAVFGVIFRQERLSAANWPGIILIAAGALLAASSG